MSNPFFGRQPAIIPFSFSTDTKGAASIKLRPRASFWWAGKAVAKLSSGVAIWEASAGGAIFTGWGQGQRAEIAGLMVAPGDVIQIDIIGGPASVAGTGSLVGVQGATMLDVVDGFSSHPNTLAVTSTQPSTILEQVNLASGQHVDIVVPAGTTYLFCALEPNGTLHVEIIGQTFVPSLALTPSPLYYDETFSAGVALPLIRYVPVDNVMDATVRMINNGPGALNVAEVSARTDPIPSSLVTPQPQFTSFVSLVNSSPAPWQAPGLFTAIPATSINSGASLALIGAVGGKTVYLHDYSFSQDAANAAAQWQLQDSTGAAISSFFDAAVRKVFASGNFGGVPLVAGRGLQMVNGGVAASFLAGFISYSQQ